MLKPILMLLVSQFALPLIYACAWPLGSDKSYIGINYSISEYNSIFRTVLKLTFHQIKLPMSPGIFPTTRV